MNTIRNTFFKQVKWLVSLMLVLSAIGANLPVVQASISGSRPLLVILMSFNDKTFDAGRTLAHYKGRIFGPALPNVTAYFQDNSNGIFTYVPAIAGDLDGTADGMLRVTMNVPFGHAPTGSEFRSQVLGLANPVFNFSRYDTDRDGILQNDELTVLVVQANDGDSGKTATAGDVSYDQVSVNGLPVAVMSQDASNYVLYHELTHTVDFAGATRFDMYNLRDGYRQKATMWQVSPDGTLLSAGTQVSEIAQELETASLPGGEALSAYRDQNGELRLATWDLSTADRPLFKKTASAGLAYDVSVAMLSPLRAVTALRQGNGALKLIAWDINLAWELTRRGDITEGIVGDVALAAAGSGRVVVACQTADGNLKLIAFDVSAAGEFIRRGSYTAGGASEMNLVALTPSRLVAAVRQAGGDLKLIVFDLGADGSITRAGDYQAGIASQIDLAQLSLHRVAASVRTELGNLKTILFDVSDQGLITRLGSYEDGPASADSQASVIGVAQTRLAVSYRNAAGHLVVLTLDSLNDGGTLSLLDREIPWVDPAAHDPVEEHIYSTHLVRVSGSLFATIVQLDGQIWTGRGFSLTGASFTHIDPYTKLQLGWVTSTDCGPRSGPVDLRYQGGSPAQNQVAILRAPGHRVSEYFIIEARSRGSVNESGLADQGLAIWHVDENKVYPQPFVSLEWLGGTPQTALWDPAHPAVTIFDDSSSPAGARWNDSSPSGLGISQVENIPGGMRFTCAAFEPVRVYLPNVHH